MGLGALISPEMVERIRRRAADPETRTDVPTPGETSHFGGMFKTVVVALDGSSPKADELPDPLGANEIAETEARLGFALPEDLAHVLTEVADGGFGPGGGLPSLREMTSRYLDMITESPDRYGRPWPTNLFPIDAELPGADCIDLDSGHIVYWDSELAAERPGDKRWTESFTVVAESLEALLQAWLESPSPREASAAAMNEILLDGLGTSMEYWRSMTPEERAEHGLPDVGREQELFGHLGVDLDDL